MTRRRAAHGTDSGYQKHRRLGQRPCPRCCDAHNQANTLRLHRRARVEPRADLMAGYFGADDPSGYLDCRLGYEPADALTTADRGRLVAELHRLGWSDVQIATHTRMTTYTAARIRAALGLHPIDVNDTLTNNQPTGYTSNVQPPRTELPA